MKTRVLSAAVLLPVLLVIVLALPAWGTAVLFAAACALGAYELLYRTKLVQETRLVVYAMAAAFLTGLWGLSQDGTLARIGLVLFSFVLFGELLYSHAKLPFLKLCATAVAGLLVPYLLSALVRIRAMTGPAGEASVGKFYILICFILAFSADTGAYFVGRAWGKHKLAPVISPKKTVEGAIGGILSAIAVLELYGLILAHFFQYHVTYWYGIVYGLLGAVVSIVGDLTFSVIKRQVGIKDYSNLIPGHGGILDRFDSMVTVAPLVEILLHVLPFAVPGGQI